MNKVTLNQLYGAQCDIQAKRYACAKEEFIKQYSCEPKRYFSAPGRTEVSGNHTDHNHGRVLAAAVSLDVIACVCPTDDNIIAVKSQGYPEDVINTGDLTVKENEKNTSAALIRGVAAGLKARGYNIGGFKAYTTSNVLKGSGLSSSAAFEVLIGTVLNHLYNSGNISAVEIAQIAQYAENEYFGKPSGLMDQMASSVGGFTSIDFADTSKPIITPISFDLASHGHALCIIDTKGNHADLTPEYAAIPVEMKSVAAQFGKSFLRELCKQDILDNISMLREKCGDRAVLRALHFFDENDRVTEIAKCLEAGDIDGFNKGILASGNSSYKYLQNVYANTCPNEQGVSIALNLIESLLDGEGSHRVHGGGFAGTVQAFVPVEKLEHFKSEIEKVFDDGSCYVLDIRPYGGVEVDA